MARISESALNAQLAEVLKGLHPRWAEGHLLVEANHVFVDNPRLRPDMLVQVPLAQTIVLETEFEPASNVEQEARDRLGLTPTGSKEPVDHAFALCIPRSLQENQHDLHHRIRQADFRYCVLNRSELFPARWPDTGWLRGTIYDVARCMEQVMVSQQIVDKSLEILEEAIRAATCQVTGATQMGFVDIERYLGEVLNQEAGEQTTRMAMTIIANAILFHATIAGTYDIPNLESLLEDDSRSIQNALVATWKTILTDINYWPVFRVASDLIIPIKGRVADRILEILIRRMQSLNALGINTRHDLVGKMFQRLIVDRKFLATFYTRPTSSTLLAELSVSGLRHSWAALSSYPALRIADLACGTGTLLSAAYHAILTRYRHAGGDDQEVHKAMIEQSLIAADIMPAAVHLCASQLSSVHPTVLFDHTCVYTMPYGERAGEAQASGIALGSLSLLQSDRETSLFPTGDEQVVGMEVDGASDQFVLPDHTLDLVIMNPPFTRPTNHKMTGVPVPSFAGFSKSEEEQRAMSRELKANYRGLVNPVGNGYAGLASRFIDLAHKKAKVGGVIALVLPITVLRGKSWEAVRALWMTQYRDMVVVTIAGVRGRDRAFSADTDLAEALVVVTRGESSAPDEALFVNLRRRPASLLEAAEVARLCRSMEGSSGLLKAGDTVLGNYIRASLSEGGCAALRNVSVAEVMLSLCKGRLALPRYADGHDIPVTRLESLGTRGLVDRNIYNSREKTPPYQGPFEIVPLGEAPSYPVLWHHAADRERCMWMEADSEGVVRPGCAEKAIRVWQTATRLHFTRDFRLNSQSLAACLTSEPTLGGRAWPNFSLNDKDWVPLVCLWANSTLGLMGFWWVGSRQHPGRAIMTITGLPALPMIDPRALSADKVRQAAGLYERFKDKPLLPANEAYRDAVRQAIDRALLVEVLGLPEAILPAFDHMRLQWCSEPTVHGGKSTRPSGR